MFQCPALSSILAPRALMAFGFTSTQTCSTTPSCRLADVMRVGFVLHRQADAAIKSRVFFRVEGTFRRKGCGPLVIRLPAMGRSLIIHEKVNSASFGQSPDCIPRRTNHAPQSRVTS